MSPEGRGGGSCQSSKPWKFGRVTSTDEFFKDMVEINGKPKYINWVRVPNEPID
jgi:hypothetical protein